MPRLECPSVSAETLNRIEWEHDLAPGAPLEMGSEAIRGRFGIWGLGFKVCLGFRVEGVLGFRV